MGLWDNDTSFWPCNSASVWQILTLWLWAIPMNWDARKSHLTVQIEKSSKTALVFLEEQKHILNTFTSNSLYICQITSHFTSIFINLLHTYRYVYYTHIYIHNLLSTKIFLYKIFVMFNIVKKKEELISTPQCNLSSVRSRITTHEWCQITDLLLHSSYYSSFSPKTSSI